MSDKFAEVLRTAADFQYAYGHFFDKTIVLERLKHTFRPRSHRRSIRTLTGVFYGAYREYHSAHRGNLIVRRRIRDDLREYEQTGVLPLYVMGAYWHSNSPVRKEPAL